jgi:hypothetical protein
MSVSLSKDTDAFASNPLHSWTLAVRSRRNGGRALGMADRTLLRNDYLDGLSAVLRPSRTLKQYSYDYDSDKGSWGVWDRFSRKFVGHAGSETGVRVMARRMNQEGK